MSTSNNVVHIVHFYRPIIKLKLRMYLEYKTVTEDKNITLERKRHRFQINSQ